MKTIINIKSLKDLERIISGYHLGPHKINLVCEPYCYDERINWDTYIIKNNGYVLGFSNGVIE